MADNFVMLVEGPDDFHVLQHLLTRHEVDKQIAYQLEGGRPAPKLTPGKKIVFRVLEGVQNVRKEVIEYLSQQLKITGDLKCLGVVVDADADCAARWQSLRDVLIKSGYMDAPKQPHPTGTILTHTADPEEKPRVGIWIMPDNTLPGMTEDFIRLLVPADDTLWEKAKSCVEQIPEAERLFGETAFIKAHVHTWLAWQEVPGLPMGQAINKRWLNADAPEALQFVSWLRRLFDLSEPPG
jgi:hypothetical protein